MRTPVRGITVPTATVPCDNLRDGRVPELFKQCANLTIC